MMEKNQANMNVKKKKKRVRLQPKPYVKGTLFSGFALKRSTKVLMYYGIYLFFFLVVGATLSFKNPLLNLLMNVGTLGVTVALPYLEGFRNGDTDVSVGEIIHLRRESGKTIDPADLDRSYHPVKGVLTALAGAAPFLLIAIFHALVAKPQYYTLGVLPGWVDTVTAEEVRLPLSFYNRESTFAFADIARILIRLQLMPYIHIVSADQVMSMLWLDRLSPVLVLLPAAGYVIGYLRGPQSRAFTHGSIAANNRRYKRKQQKERKARQTENKQII